MLCLESSRRDTVDVLTIKVDRWTISASDDSSEEVVVPKYAQVSYYVIDASLNSMTTQEVSSAPYAKIGIMKKPSPNQELQVQSSFTLH